MLRLDFNENTMGPSPRVAEAIRAFPADQIAIYPEYDGLREALIANLEASPAGLASVLTPAHVGVFNGVDAAIHAQSPPESDAPGHRRRGIRAA